MLHKLQTAFLKSIYNPGLEEDALTFIREVDNRILSEQLAVYRGSIFAGLKKALAQTYPVTKQLVGDDFFELMLGDYIIKYPCRVQDLNDYGKELPDFISELAHARTVPYLADMARLEWHYNCSLNAKCQPNNLSELPHLNQPQQRNIKFHLPQGNALLYSGYPVDRIWNMHINNIETEITFTEQQYFLYIYKDNTANCIARLTAQQSGFLSRLRQGSKFSDVCEDMLTAYPEVDISHLLADAIRNGWLVSYSL